MYGLLVTMLWGQLVFHGVCDSAAADSLLPGCRDPVSWAEALGLGPSNLLDGAGADSSLGFCSSCGLTGLWVSSVDLSAFVKCSALDAFTYTMVVMSTGIKFA